jgi:hypothetical protein
MSYHDAMERNPAAFVFSARAGNGYDFACLLVGRPKVFVLGSLEVKPCSRCDYECLRDALCPIVDDMPVLFEVWASSNPLILMVPVYDGRPPALFYAFFERMPGLWGRKLEGFRHFRKDAALVVTGSEGLGSTIGHAKTMLIGLGVSVIETVAIDPAGLAFGGKIKGGLIENPEILGMLQGLKDKLGL